MKIKTNLITLNYTCSNCGTKAEQDLSEIMECGTAVCSECDRDMDLDDQVDAAILN